MVIALHWRMVELRMVPGTDSALGPAMDTSLDMTEVAELRRLAGTSNRILEVGSAYGFSTVVLAQSLPPGGHLTAVDPHTGHNSEATLRSNLDAYGVADRVTVHVLHSQDALPQLHAAGERFDMVWIDGDHSAPVVEHDVRWALRLLNDNGVLAVHDYDEVTCPGVRVALDILFSGPGRLVNTMATYNFIGTPDPRD